MRIGIVAPISHPIPPQGYGPWEQVAYDEVEALVALGHDVTLFAPDGTRTSARLSITVPAPLTRENLDPRLVEEEHVAIAMTAVGEDLVDVVHSHLHVHALGYSRFLRRPLVSTLHGSAWNHEHHRLLGRYRDQPFVSISDAERAFYPSLNYVGTVYNGIDLNQMPFRSEKDDYLLYVGRLAPEKAPDLAIATARLAGHRLLLVGPREPRHSSFFTTAVEPHLGPDVDYVGPMPRADLLGLVAGAKGLLMPLRWDEPFGLVVVEALACGTPVIGWRRGALPELIADGAHGFLVDEVEGAAKAVRRLGDLDPAVLRMHVEARFSRRRMAEGYADVFERVTARVSAASVLRNQRIRRSKPAAL